MDKLTVVVLNDFCHVQGGASKVAIDEACALAEAGCEVIFLGAVGPVCDALRRAKLRTICLNQPELLDVAKHPLVALQGMWNRLAWQEMRKLLRTLDPARTVVHLHGYTKALSTSPLRTAQAARFATVCTLHDFFAACPNGAFFDYVQLAPCTRRAMSASCITTNCDKRAYPHKLFRVARSAAHRVDGFPKNVHHYIALSRRSGEKMRPYLPQGARLTSLPNVIETEFAPPVNTASNQALVHVGRLDEEKGVRLLADAAQHANRIVRFVGDGPLRPALEGRPGLSITGWVSPEQVQAELSQARALAFPSLWYETYGLVVAEAASRGVPALVSDIAAPAERVRHGVTGWHVRAGDVNAWARAIGALADDQAVAAAGAAAHAEFWAAPATPASHAEALLTIYRQTLAEVRSAPTPGWTNASVTAVSGPQ
jgi:glycosyltransferase involved in cell wall biosynthesis